MLAPLAQRFAANPGEIWGSEIRPQLPLCDRSTQAKVVVIVVVMVEVEVVGETHFEFPHINGQTTSKPLLHN